MRRFSPDERPLIFLTTIGILLLLPSPGPAQTAPAREPPLVKVTVEFRQAGQGTQSGAAGSGQIIIQRPGGVTGSGAIQLQEQYRRTRQSTGMFLLVQDGEMATLTVASQVPQVAWFYQYALGQGYVAAGVVFRQVGTGFRVRPTVLPNNRIRLRITPQVSYVADQATGEVEFVEASTEVIVGNGQSVTIASSRTATQAVTSQILAGYQQAHGVTDLDIVVTPEVQ